jgi:hypothetical protein
MRMLGASQMALQEAKGGTMSSGGMSKVEPVLKRLKVGLQREAAFRLFTEGISTWWPLKTHSVGEDQAVSCVMEGKAGGRIYEVMKDGRESEWGKVLVWEPFTKLVFTWHPGRTPDTAQEVTVVFQNTPSGTLVELEHGGWELLGDKAPSHREGYDMGWDLVLASFIIKASGT